MIISDVMLDKYRNTEGDIENHNRITAAALL